MARMRYLKPEFWTDGKVVKLSPWARLLFMGSWNFALCERGHLDDDAMALKLKVLPADPIDADEVLEEVIASGRIKRRQMADGRTYLHVVHLADHQKVDSRWTSRCPYCAHEDSGAPANSPPASPSLSETLPSSEEPPDSHQDSAQEGMGGEGNRRGEEGSTNSRGSAASDRPARAPTFEDFWAVFPDTNDKKPARTKWDAAVKAGVDPAVILAGAIRYRDDPNREQPFTKMAKTWLNNACWENGPLPPRQGRRAGPGGEQFRNGLALAERARQLEAEAEAQSQLMIEESA